MTVDEIRELIALATESGVAELEVQRGDNRVRIRRASFAAPQEIVVAAPTYAAPSAAPTFANAPSPAHSALEAPKSFALFLIFLNLFDHLCERAHRGEVAAIFFRLGR